MPSMTFDASNELPPKFYATLVGISGQDFPPGTSVNIGVLADGDHVLAHAMVFVNPDGGFEWGSIVRPKLACNSIVSAVVHSEGTKLTATAEVFCP